MSSSWRARDTRARLRCQTEPSIPISPQAERSLAHPPAPGSSQSSTTKGKPKLKHNDNLIMLLKSIAMLWVPLRSRRREARSAALNNENAVDIPKKALDRESYKLYYVN